MQHPFLVYRPQKPPADSRFDISQGWLVGVTSFWGYFCCAPSPSRWIAFQNDANERQHIDLTWNFLHGVVLLGSYNADQSTVLGIVKVVALHVGPLSILLVQLPPIYLAVDMRA